MKKRRQSINRGEKQRAQTQSRMTGSSQHKAREMRAQCSAGWQEQKTLCTLNHSSLLHITLQQNLIKCVKLNIQTFPQSTTISKCFKPREPLPLVCQDNKFSKFCSSRLVNLLIFFFSGFATKVSQFNFLLLSVRLKINHKRNALPDSQDVVLTQMLLPFQQCQILKGCLFPIPLLTFLHSA